MKRGVCGSTSSPFGLLKGAACVCYSAGSETIICLIYKGDSMVQCVLRCWACGKEIKVGVDAPPQFAVDLVKLAQAAGWVGVIDMDHLRSLVFCSLDCVHSAQTKRGSFRRRPKPNKSLDCQP